MICQGIANQSHKTGKPGKRLRAPEIHRNGYRSLTIVAGDAHIYTEMGGKPRPSRESIAEPLAIDRLVRYGRYDATRRRLDGPIFQSAHPKLTPKHQQRVDDVCHTLRTVLELCDEHINAAFGRDLLACTRKRDWADAVGLAVEAETLRRSMETRSGPEATVIMGANDRKELATALLLWRQLLDVRDVAIGARSLPLVGRLVHDNQFDFKLAGAICERYWKRLFRGLVDGHTTTHVAFSVCFVYGVFRRKATDPAHYESQLDTIARQMSEVMRFFEVTPEKVRAAFADETVDRTLNGGQRWRAAVKAVAMMIGVSKTSVGSMYKMLAADDETVIVTLKNFGTLFGVPGMLSTTRTH